MNEKLLEEEKKPPSGSLFLEKMRLECKYYSVSEFLIDPSIDLLHKLSHIRVILLCSK